MLSDLIGSYQILSDLPYVVLRQDHKYNFITVRLIMEIKTAARKLLQ